MFGERFLRRTFAREGLDRRGLCRRFFRCQFVLARGRLSVFQLHLELIEKASLPLRSAAVELAPQLLDRQRQMGDQRLGI